MVYFCALCWNEVHNEAKYCQKCGADLAAADSRPFVEKLRRALWHPEPQTAVRAAWILGERREKSAVEDLLRVLETTSDTFLAEAAAEALGKIGDKRSLAGLKRVGQRGSVRVRQAIRQALEQVLLSPPSPGKNRSRYEEE